MDNFMINVNFLARLFIKWMANHVAKWVWWCSSSLRKSDKAFLFGCMGCQGQKVFFLPLSRRITSEYDDDVTRYCISVKVLKNTFQHLTHSYVAIFCSLSPLLCSPKWAHASGMIWPFPSYHRRSATIWVCATASWKTSEMWVCRVHGHYIYPLLKVIIVPQWVSVGLHDSLKCESRFFSLTIEINDSLTILHTARCQ